MAVVQGDNDLPEDVSCLLLRQTSPVVYDILPKVHVPHLHNYRQVARGQERVIQARHVHMQQGVMVQDLPSHVLCDLESSFNELDSYIAIVLAVQCHQDVGLVGVRPANLLIARMPVQGIVAVLQSWRAGSSGQPARPATICCALVAADCFAELLEVWVGVLLDVPLPVFLLQPAGVIACSAVELRHDNIAVRTACERFSEWCAVLAPLNAV